MAVPESESCVATTMEKCDVVILGAGPYGLAAATHLKNVQGLAVRIFGEPMSFWERNMPLGMFLRSNWTATQIADPHLALTLEEYGSESGSKVSQPVPLDRFVQYGHWYQQKGVPDLDQRRVSRVERSPNGFRITLSDGEVLGSRRVVVAAGIGSFAWRPPEFDGLPVELASHTSEHRDLGKFTGKKVLVVGGVAAGRRRSSRGHCAHP